mmetsp:Transcript_24106/g.47254  ORF Transcript_24106/g.47254 Transcript_24106/m.47254 type:complete len:238 (-) Transcript_24106:303-1016(-)
MMCRCCMYSCAVLAVLAGVLLAPLASREARVLAIDELVAQGAQGEALAQGMPKEWTGLYYLENNEGPDMVTLSFLIGMDTSKCRFDAARREMTCGMDAMALSHLPTDAPTIRTLPNGMQVHATKSNGLTWLDPLLALRFTYIAQLSEDNSEGRLKLSVLGFDLLAVLGAVWKAQLRDGGSVLRRCSWSNESQAEKGLETAAYYDAVRIKDADGNIDKDALRRMKDVWGENVMTVAGV